MLLIEGLQDSALFDHPVTGFEVIETHISWVLLTGQYVYKIKKPDLLLDRNKIYKVIFDVYTDEEDDTE